MFLLASITLPESLLRALREEAEKRGTTPEALMVRLLLGIVSGEERPRVLLEAARNSLEHARSHWSNGEYSEAYRRLWVSVLLGLEAYAYYKGGSPGSGLEWYWSTAGSSSEEIGEEVFDAFYSGLAAFIASRESLGDGPHFSAISSRVSRFLDKVEELVEAMGS